MLSAVQYGTATGISLPNVTVAGKTGTAEFPGPRDSKGRLPTHAWFTAFAPYEDPEIAIIVFIKGGGEGSLVAVPVAHEVLSYFFSSSNETEGGDSMLVPPTPVGMTAGQIITGGQVIGGGQPATSTETGAQPAPGEPPPAAMPGMYTGRLVKVEPAAAETSVLIGTVVDSSGAGIPGVQVTINGGGEPIFEPVTGPNGEFRYNLLNAYSSPRWNVRVLDVLGSEEIHLDVEPFRQYTVQFTRQ